jgi:two-component system cell cycle sensor histidine kinase/response regulator CckA
MTLPSPPPVETRLRVLIVEDNANDAELIIREATKAGFKFDWQRVETEAEFLAELVKAPDLILSDYSLPRFDGLRAVASVRERGLDTPFILVSGTLGEEAAVEAMRFGADDYLMKGNILRLGLAIHRALEGKRLRDERKHVEENLIRMNERFELATRAASLGIWDWDVPKNQLVWDDRMFELYGVNGRDFTGAYEAWVRGLHPLDAARAEAEIQQALRGEKEFDTEFRVVWPDGTVHYMRASAEVIRDGIGQPIRMTGVNYDITGRVHSEEARMRLAAIVTASDDAIFSKTLDGVITAWNPGAERLFGYSANEAIGQRAAMLFPPDQLQAEMEILARLARGESVKQFDTVRIRKDGTPVDVSVMVSPISYPDSTITSFASISRDITERKTAEERLRKLSHAVEQSPALVVITDKAGNVEYVNPKFTQVSAYQLEDVLGKNPRIWKSGETSQEEYQKLWTTITAGGEWHGEFLNRTKDGEVYRASAALSAIRDATGNITHFLSVAEDVTARRSMEEQYRQAQKMEGIGQLASGVAHDFNNILAVIQMQAGLLKEGHNLSPEHDALADDIGHAVERAAALTRQLLLFSRKEVLRAQDLDLNQSIESVLKMLRRTIGEAVQMKLNLAAEPMWLHADPGMMDQVLLNLCVNARDAMPAGGQLVIETSGVVFDAEAASQTANMRPGSFVCLTVSDTGCGIPSESFSKIFEPFFTTKEVGKGPGLGLSTVFGIIEQHHGWINVYSEVGHGTTVRICLPRLPQRSGRKSPEPSLTAMPGGNETILLVEDEPAVRNVTIRALTRLGYQVLDASNAFEALAVWKAHRDEIQLVLTDMVMPGGMNGIQLGAELLKDRPTLKVIYASGYSADVAGADFPLMDGVNFLTKPYDRARLAQTVRAMLEA